MDKTGLINRYFEAADREWSGRIALEATQEAARHRAFCSNLLNLLKAIKKFGDYSLMLMVEHERVRFDLSTSTSKEMRASNQAAMAELAQAQNVIKHVRDPEFYVKLAASFAPTDLDKDGLPKDALIKFVGSQLLRIRNLKTARMSVPEENIWRLRKEILIEMRTLHKVQQRKALGLEPLELKRHKGLSR